jgi:colanic acid/amylovoran biosynthesis glycosyltransferase
LPYAGRRWDIIYFPWNSAAIAHLPVFDLGTPVVVSCRGAQVSVAPHHPERAELRAGLRDTFARAAAVHCVSEATFREAAAFGLERAKTWVIHPAVDPDVFRPRVTGPARDEVFRVITTGSLIWRKGGEWALSAIRLLRDYGVPVQLVMLGEGPDRQRLLYSRGDLGLEEVVRFPGRLEPAAVLAELQQADVFLLSSLSEGLANSVLEAMACGIPVVTTDCGGMREAVTDGVEGFVTPVRNAEALARAMLRLARDRDLRERMGRAGRARILREFGLARQIGQWLALFRSVLSRGKVAADETCVDLERPSDVPTCVNG